MTNMLLQPMFSVVTEDEESMVNLPGLLALLGQDKIDSLPGIRRHQEDIFHVFLCQLAAVALVRSGERSPCHPPDQWLSMLRRLARSEGCEDDSLWTLVVEDVTRPAFMQPPASTVDVFAGDYKSFDAAPDAIDTLQTAKNHDIKGTRGIHAAHESWIYALIALQTSIGFLGAGNFGIARMNGGFGSRVIVSWTDSLRLGQRFITDTTRLIGMRQDAVDKFHFDANGRALLWSLPWDGADSLALTGLDPGFIEVSRRIRLVANGQDIRAMRATSNSMRVAAKELKGVIDDPWTPVTVKTNGALTVPASGFTAELLRNLLFGDGYVAAPMQLPPPGGGDGWLTASVLVRGQGTTDGFHEALVRIPAPARSLLMGGTAGRDRLAALSKKGLDMASGVSRAMRYAMTAFLEGGPEKITMDRREISAWVDAASHGFRQEWSRQFFDWLWGSENEPDDTKALKPWFATLKNLAGATLTRTFMKTPARSGRTYRARTQAEGVFHGTIYKKYHDYMENNNG